MNLLFIGLTPSRDLGKALLANGLPFDSTKRLPPRGDFDLITFAPQKTNQIALLADIKKRWPLAWITIVVPPQWLQSESTLPELLRRPEKNEISLVTFWEQTFWFSLQNSILFRTNKLKMQSLKTHNRTLRRECDELKVQSQTLLAQLQKDIDLASQLQHSLLPKGSPEIAGVSLAVKYMPAAGLGGDYYDIFEFGDKRRFGILIADSRTHGMAASLLSVLVKVRLEEMKDKFPDSKSFVEFLNREIRLTHRANPEPLSLLYGILDRSSLKFQYTISGSLKPLLWRDGECPALPLNSAPPLGNVDHYNFEENTIRLLPGDLLILHTDGLEGPLQGNAETRIREILTEKEELTPRELQNELMGIIDRHLQKNKLKDDLTLIQLGINEQTLYLAPTA